MKDLRKVLGEIYKSRPGLMRMMVGLLVAGVGLLVYSLVALQPGGAVVKVGYGDISSYRDGAWWEMLAFPILAVILGGVQNFLAVKIYERRGVGMAKVVVVCSVLLVLFALITLIRITGEG